MSQLTIAQPRCRVPGFLTADLKLIVLITNLTPGASPGAGVQYNSQCPDDHNIDDGGDDSG